MSMPSLSPNSVPLFDNLPAPHNDASATPPALQYPCISAVPFSGYAAATLPTVAGGA